MKRRIIGAIVYAVTSLALALFFDALYGAGPVKNQLWLIRLALTGTALFALGCVSSFFSFRIGVICGLCASTLALPYFALLAIAVPWGSLRSVLPYANWPYILTAILALASSTIYSITNVSRAFRPIPSA